MESDNSFTQSQEIVGPVQDRFNTASHTFLREPAWLNHTTTPANLVLEGGAMRCQFTAGVLDFFIDNNLFCEHTIGVSAGALCGYYYVAGERGRSNYLNLKYCNDSRYFSMKSFALTGNACGREFTFDEIPNKLDPFNYAGFNKSPMKLTAVSSDLVTGEADYHLISDAIGDLPYLISTSSIPLMSQIVKVDGKFLLDGGTCDSVPITYSLLTGAQKHIVVRTQAACHKKGPEKLITLSKQRYSSFPYFVERLQYRHCEYNRVARSVRRMHEDGEVFLIQPPTPIAISNMEKDVQKLQALYDQGYEEASRQWDALQEYLSD